MVYDPDRQLAALNTMLRARERRIDLLTRQVDRLYAALIWAVATLGYYLLLVGFLRFVNPPASPLTGLLFIAGLVLAVVTLMKCRRALEAGRASRAAAAAELTGE